MARQGSAARRPGRRYSMKASRLCRDRGIAIVPIFLCFVLIVLISGGLLRIGLAQRDQASADEKQLQCEWLVESGLERAAARLAASPDYAGETWAIGAEELGTRWPATVKI